MMLNNNKHEKSFSRSKSVSDDLVIFPSLKPSNNDKGLHMFVWSSTSSPTSDVNMKHRVNTVGSADFEIIGSSKFVDFSHETVASKAVHEREIEEGDKLPVKEVSIEEGNANKKQKMQRASVMIKLILTMVCIRNLNTWASVLGLVWSLIFFRWNIKMPSIVKYSIKIMSDTGLEMTMFNLGLFMAL
ncbi:hypothetical protein GLYMA_09G061750v4 [Glycine max]|nr:hypothetical protein GLYMA_09G061750v4 [Glycine max]KAH1041726.1 hypothetical protein GYH30_024202 [Glycine max]